MVNKITVTNEKTYSFWIATQKVLKNAAIFLLPSLVAYQTKVPDIYGPLAGMVIYYIKYWIKNK